MGSPASVKHSYCAFSDGEIEEYPTMKKAATQEDSTRTVSPPLLLSIPDVAASLGLGRSKVYELIAKEGLPVVRFGRSVRVSVASLQKWVEQREQHPFPQ
jgi:excisionase family DNA binding protein